jgi:hypothetical protein
MGPVYPDYAYGLKDVSFRNVDFREGSVAAIASGFFAGINGIQHPTTATALTIGGCDPVNGCQVNGMDTVYTGDWSPPFSAGDFVWNIPWQYAVVPRAWVTFTTATHHQWADAAPNLGRAHIEKKGAGPFTKDANDPTSGY